MLEQDSRNDKFKVDQTLNYFCMFRGKFDRKETTNAIKYESNPYPIGLETFKLLIEKYFIKIKFRS